MASRDRQLPKGASGTPALDRGLSVLELLVESRSPLRANDLAQALGIPNCSIGRILDNLVARGYVEREDRTMAYELTGKLLAMAAITVCEKHLIEEAMEEMRELRDWSGETVNINARSGAGGVVLETMPSRQQVRLAVDPGTPHLLHCTAPGKVLLAFLPVKELEERLQSLELPAVTEHTVTDRRAFREEIAAVQACGYAEDRQETLAGVHCLSAPIFDRSGACIAALTLSAPAARMPKNHFPEAARQVTEHARRISERLGCRLR